MERDGLSVCAKKTGENASHEGKTDTTNVHQKQGLDCQICHEETLKPENATAIKDKAEHDVQPILGAKFVRIPLKGTDIDEDALYGEMNGKTLGLSLLNQSFTCKCPTICVGKIDVKLV